MADCAGAVWDLLMLTDLRFALRQMARLPLFALFTIITLAAGFGANVAVYSVADAIVFRPLPYPNADRLVMLWEELSNVGVRRLQLSKATFDVYGSDRNVFDQAAAFQENERDLRGVTNTDRVMVMSAGPGLLTMLGARVSIGKLFADDNAAGERADVAVLSYPMFVSHFGGNPSVIGQTVQLDNRLYIAIGVLSPDFKFSARQLRTDIWVPLDPSADGKAKFGMLARLRPDVNIGRARNAVNITAAHINQTLHPYSGPNGENVGYRAVVVPIREQLLGDFRQGAIIMIAVSFTMLLMACVNLSNLMLVRLFARRDELDMRRALGASKARIIRQFLTESAIIGVLAGVAGSLFSYFGISFLVAFSPAKIPATTKIGFDARIILFTFALTLLMSILFGLAPSLSAAGVTPRTRGSRRRNPLSAVLVAVEMAMALVLLVGSGLLLKSFLKLRDVNLGFRRDHLLTMEVRLRPLNYPDGFRRAAFFAAAQEELGKLPHVTATTSISRLPIAVVGNLDALGGNPFSLEGRPWNPRGLDRQAAHTQTVGLGYFRTMSIPLLGGRDFSELDGPDAPPVAIVNETLGQRFFPNSSAIGHQILIGAPTPGARWMRILGIAGDVKTGAPDQATMPQFYTPVAQDAPTSMNVVLRTSTNPLESARAASDTIRKLDPDAVVSHIGTMEDRIDESVREPYVHTVIVLFFGLGALFLAAIGVYGIVAHESAQRSREIGIRLALGASTSQVIRTVVYRGMAPVGVGLFLGAVAAAGLAQLLASALFGVRVYDPSVFIFAAAILAAVALAACSGPALRSIRIDPAIALREE
jgi:predicted permease